MTVIAVDAMGGDHGPSVTVPACLDFLEAHPDARQELQSTFEDMAREIQHVIEQMTEAERRHYLSESLFLNVVSYENERLGAYVKKLTQK